MKKKNKKGQGRPKSDKPIKEIVISGRVTKEHKEIIIKLFGSIKKFMEVSIANAVNWKQ